MLFWNLIKPILALLGRVAAAVRQRIEPLRLRLAAQRGDVPGWVLVTVMTAGLVTALWVVANARLTDVLSRAISSVTGP